MLIREIDPETSFIDSIQVVLFHEDGSKEVLFPEMDKLRAMDGDYFVTKQGDDVEVTFEPAAREGFLRAEIISHGYYEPY